MEIYHVSEDGSIERFVPRVPANRDSGVFEEVVWGVDEVHLVNYLLPRDCPRVTFARGGQTTPDDVERFLGPPQFRRVVVIESAWYERATRTPLWIYRLPAETFRVIDAGAGYSVSLETVDPLSRQRIENPIDALLRRGTELRIVPDLWPLHDAVAESTLEFSCIRMRNAQPRLRL